MAVCARKHASTFDTNGVLRWIGTGGGTKAYQNPHEKPGGVVGKMSSMYSGCAPSVFVDVGQAGNGNAWSGYNSTSNYPNSWMSVDLGEGRLPARLPISGGHNGNARVERRRAHHRTH